MKNKFKTKCNKNKPVLGKLIFLTLTLIIFVTLFFLTKFSTTINENLISIASAEINRLNFDIIGTKLTSKILNEETLNDILIITKNNQEEIISVDFNLPHAYQLLDNITSILNANLNSIKNGEIALAYLDRETTKRTNNLTLFIPLGSGLNNNLFYNMGPKIPLKINFIGSILTNLETKITNYGLNNALVELFVYIEFHNQIISSFKTEDQVFKYNTVIASEMINGAVPNFYNGTIDKTSESFTKSLE